MATRRKQGGRDRDSSLLESSFRENVWRAKSARERNRILGLNLPQGEFYIM
jgi:hypothetical protein